MSKDDLTLDAEEQKLIDALEIALLNVDQLNAGGIRGTAGNGEVDIVPIGDSVREAIRIAVKDKLADLKLDAFIGMENFYVEAAVKEAAHNEAVLDQVKNLRGDDFYAAVLKYIEEGDGFISFSLSNGKAGERQECGRPGDTIQYEWVNQSCGPCGDDYYGDVYIHVIAGIYLKIYFQC